MPGSFARSGGQTDEWDDSGSECHQHGPEPRTRPPVQGHGPRGFRVRRTPGSPLGARPRRRPDGPGLPSQLRVLYTLDREEGINLRMLAEALGSASPSVSRLCDRLQATGLVERAPSPVSRRELELRLTSHGKAYLVDLRMRRKRY